MLGVYCASVSVLSNDSMILMKVLGVLVPLVFGFRSFWWYFFGLMGLFSDRFVEGA